MNFIKKYWRGIVALLLIAAITLLIKLWPRPKPSIPTTQEVVNPLELKKVDSIRDHNDKLYAKVAEKVYTQAQVSHLLDSVALALGVKVKNIKGVEKLVFRDSIVYRDKTKLIFLPSGDSAYTIEKHDAWNDIVAVAGKDTGYIHAYIWDSLTRIDVTKTKLFGPTIHQIYINHSNPNITTTQGASFTIKEKQPWLVIGPSVGYDPFQKHVTIGVTATYPILTLRK